MVTLCHIAISYLLTKISINSVLVLVFEGYVSLFFVLTFADKMFVFAVGSCFTAKGCLFLFRLGHEKCVFFERLQFAK